MSAGMLSSDGCKARQPSPVSQVAGETSSWSSLDSARVYAFFDFLTPPLSPLSTPSTKGARYDRGDTACLPACLPHVRIICDCNSPAPVRLAQRSRPSAGSLSGQVLRYSGKMPCQSDNEGGGEGGGSKALARGGVAIFKLRPGWHVDLPSYLPSSLEWSRESFGFSVRSKA